MNEIKSKRQAAQVLARIIAERPTEVKDALFESGVDVSPTATDRQVIESIVTNVGRNRMLQQKLGELAGNNDFFGTNGEAATTASSTANGFFQDSGNVQAVGNVIGQALGFWLGSRREKQSREAAERQAEQQLELARINADLVERQLELENARLGNQPQGMSTGAKIGIGLAIVAVVVTAVLLVRNKGKKAAAPAGS